MLKYAKKAMKKYVLVLSCLLTFTFVGCNYSKTDGLPHKGTDKTQESRLKISWDSLVVDISYTSGRGSFFMYDSVISFADSYYAKLYNFDCRTGTLLSSKFGVGDGPDEMRRYISAHPVGNDSVIMFVDGNGIVTLCGMDNYQLYRKKEMNFKWINNHSSNYDSPEIYGFDYFANIYNYQGKYVIPVTPLWHRMNSDASIPVDMYKKGHIFGLLDINTMEVMDVFGKFSDIYSEQNIPHCANFNYTLHKNIIYVSFAADSLIYVYEFPDKLLYTFGYECTGIDRSYTTLASFRDENADADRERCGLNREIHHFPNMGLFFRTYWTGIKQNKYGMQIYDEECNLIADILVPETFQLLGYYSPYFCGMTAPVETDDETWLTFYKLKITE
jgi:hypothetical protein